MTGQPTLVATSITLMIFSPYTSPSAPPNTVASWLNTATGLPSIVPVPVTTPSPNGRRCSIPKLVERCRVSASSSTNEPGSSSISSRSRAVWRPLACWRSRRLRVGLQRRVAPMEVGQLARGGVEIGLGVLRELTSAAVMPRSLNRPVTA